MTAMFAALVLAVVVGGLAVLFSAQRRVEEARYRADVLAERNHRLERALGVAEQALRSLSHDTRLDAGMSVEIDMALQDIHRAAREDGPGLDR